MPVFSTRKTDVSHSELILEFASTSAEQEYCRIFPDPMPETHALAYRWEYNGPRRPRRLVVGPAKRGAASPAPMPAQPAPEAAPAPIAAQLDSGVVAGLEKLSLPDLETRAAELGVSVYLNGKGGKKLTQAQLVAAVAKATAPKPNRPE
jgi:hypothetical protein